MLVFGLGQYVLLYLILNWVVLAHYFIDEPLKSTRVHPNQCMPSTIQNHSRVWLDLCLSLLLKGTTLTAKNEKKKKKKTQLVYGRGSFFNCE